MTYELKRIRLPGGNFITKKLPCSDAADLARAKPEEIWTCGDKREILIRDMELMHLVNCMKILRERTQLKLQEVGIKSTTVKGLHKQAIKMFPQYVHMHDEFEIRMGRKERPSQQQNQQPKDSSTYEIMTTIPKLMMVFDVESIGLHGEGFAVGWTIINDMGVEITSALIACNPNDAEGTEKDRKWIKENIPPIKSLTVCNTPHDARSQFWAEYQNWKKKGAVLFAECLWPVEANFLRACVADNSHHARDFEGPYPFHEIASIMLAAGMNPMATYPREQRELPAHNPLSDARQSARLLMTAFKELSKINTP